MCKNHVFSDTISAISTAQANGGIGIVRMSGINALNIADKMFRSFDNTKISELKGYSAKYGKILDNNTFIDDVIILVFKSPHSYTGENIVEISCHGGLFLTRRILKITLNLGARLAKPGEFTKRAFLNGKMNLVQAESVMDIISARNKIANEIAYSNKEENNIGNRISILKDKLIDISSKISVWIDYPEDDYKEFDTTNVLNELHNILFSINKMIDTYDLGQAIMEGIRTSIVGKTNVGKSTLMNVLLGKNRAIVTDVPGTTRDTIEDTVIFDDISLRLTDTAGIRNTNDTVEKIGIEKSKNMINNSELILAVFDGSNIISDEDKMILDITREKRRIIVVNKTDLPNKLDIEPLLRDSDMIVKLSAKNEINIEELKNTIYKSINICKSDENDVIISNERHLDCLNRVKKILNQTIQEIENNMTFDVISLLFQECIDIFNEFTGERASDEIIERVFSKFCVGK